MGMILRGRDLGGGKEEYSRQKDHRSQRWSGRGREAQGSEAGILGMKGTRR